MKKILLSIALLTIVSTAAFADTQIVTVKHGKASVLKPYEEQGYECKRISGGHHFGKQKYECTKED